MTPSPSAAAGVADTTKPTNTKKQQQQKALGDEEGKEASPGAVELAVFGGGAAPPAAGSPAAAAPSMAVDDLITRGIKPARLRAITLYVRLSVCRSHLLFSPDSGDCHY